MGLRAGSNKEVNTNSEIRRPGEDSFVAWIEQRSSVWVEKHWRSLGTSAMAVDYDERDGSRRWEG